MHLRRLWRAQTILRQAATTSGGKKKGGGQQGEKNKENCSGLALMNQSFQENQQNPTYSMSIASLPRFWIKHPHLTSVYRCCFKSRLRSRVEACDWTPGAAPELYFEEETTKPQIMLHSPLGSTMAIRFFFVLFSLCESFLYTLSDGIYTEKELGTRMPRQRPWTINHRKWKSDSSQSGRCRKSCEKNKIINDSPIISKALIELGAVGGPEVSDKINSSRWKKLDKRTGTRSWYCQDHLESSGLRFLDRKQKHWSVKHSVKTQSVSTERVRKKKGTGSCTTGTKNFSRRPADDVGLSSLTTDKHRRIKNIHVEKWQ